MSVLIAVESTYSGVMVEPNGTTTFRVLMVLNAEYEVSCGILDTQ
jgi:LEA14-like dessication related protein